EHVRQDGRRGRELLDAAGQLHRRPAESARPDHHHRAAERDARRRLHARQRDGCPPGRGCSFKVMAMRSTDGGANWSQPVTIDEVPPVQPEDESTNTQVRAFPLVSAATAPEGTLYVVYNDIESEHS